MTDSDRSLSEVPGLIEERRRYDGWLAALDARKDSTPTHVFERVQADYRVRLQRVTEQLASYRQAIEEERASVQARIALLDAEEQLQRDERAEFELRSHVGELSHEDAEAAFAVVDSEIERLVTDKTGLTNRVDELVALLEEGKTPAKPAPAIPAEAVTESSALSPPDSFAAAPAQLSIEETLDSRESAEVVSTAGLATATAASGSNGSFDELAFLSSVVGNSESDRLDLREQPSLGIESLGSEPVLRASDLVDHDSQDSLLAGIDSGTRLGTETPLSANSPIVLRPGTIEQSKTLKCNECGAMNYPTEWYCERCGAELATL
jgi:hypothetical protein